jgi:hypothetical protein
MAGIASITILKATLGARNGHECATAGARARGEKVDAGFSQNAREIKEKRVDCDSMETQSALGSGLNQSTK